MTIPGELLQSWHRRCAEELERGLSLPASCRHGHPAQGRELHCRVCGEKLFIRGDYSVAGPTVEAVGLLLTGLVFIASPYWLAAQWLAAALSVLGSLVVAVGFAMLGSFFLGMLAGGLLGATVGALMSGALGWTLVVLQGVIALFGLLARLSVLSRVGLSRRCASTMRWLEKVMNLIRRDPAGAGSSR